ncbi:Hypothetical predicted protein [Pelobates cultripes]|uniref:L1 transposable element RRM domain-containing protein n=1 Tax=Pelobates cultripes TaxID=61616 RepID=A0AAD1W253_PELCU|nr:Hypothetical predicted protein [Pelobates cultripes]
MNTPDPGSGKKNGGLDKYFRDTVTILGADSEDSQATPSLTRGSLSNSPIQSEHGSNSNMAEIKELLQNLPSKEEIAVMLTKLESSVQDQLSKMTSEVKQISNRVGDLEEDRDQILDRLLQLEQGQESRDTKLLYNMKNTEDLDNRSRRNNIRIRGLPEAQGTNEDLQIVLQSLFNRMLQRPEDTHILLDRAHRALRPKGLAQEAPRDIICRVHYYSEKEAIMRSARETAEITYNNGTQASLTTAAEVPEFTKRLGIPEVEIIDWYDLTESETTQVPPQHQRNRFQDLRRKQPWKSPPTSPFMRPRRQPATPRQIR